MEASTVPSQHAKTTFDKILDAAEDLFAAKGYSATSLGEVADVVGIRSPSLYNHFKNKEALYTAVLDRLIDRFALPLQELDRQQVTSYEEVMEWLEVVVRQHHANPNMSRLLQHAALSGGPHTSELVDRLFRPMFSSWHRISGDEIPFYGAGLQPWAVMAFNNMVMSYVTMAPMYRDVLGQDPFSEQALENQLQLVKTLLRAVFEFEGTRSER